MSSTPFGLTVSYLAYPERTTLTDPRPVFSWCIEDGIQSAYQLQVFAESGQVLWDSGQVASARSIGVRYGGSGLFSNQKFTWKVRVWRAESSRGSAWSKPQGFATGRVGTSPFPLPKNDIWENRNPLELTEIEPERIVKRGDGTYFVDFGRAWFGTLYLRGPAAARVIIHFGEKLATKNSVDRKPPGSVCYRTTETLLSARERVLVPTPKAPFSPGARRGAVLIPPGYDEVLPFRAIEVEGWPGELKKEHVRLHALHSTFDDKAAAFSCSDPTLEAVWKLCQHTFKATSFLGVSIDGERERTPYEADAYIAQLGHCHVERDWALYRWTLEYLLTYSTWPTEWAHHLILMAEADWEFTGDTTFANRLWERLERKLLRPKARPDGLLVAGAIVDWPQAERDGFGGGVQATDNRQMAGPMVNSVANAFYWHALMGMARLAKALGKLGMDYEQEAERVRKAYLTVFLDPDQGVFRDGEGSTHASLHANLFPLAFGLVPDANVPTVLALVKSKGMACSVYAAQYLLEALFAEGEAEAAIKLMLAPGDRSWRHMLEMGATMTAEAWDAKYKPNLTFSHAWGAAPANLIPRGLFGLEPLEAGYGKVALKPQAGGLAWAKLTVPTIRGPLKLAFDTRRGGFVFEVELPGNVTADVMLPGEKTPRVLGSGKHQLRT
ncbi:alpha-L-rhamnosidase C-terminal domain-containing protein [Armatimonas sp.]|uniref:alpha-L-rhamnosidase-related protein n=1 Tax=Armatimonas sp. TaxID=1872638 RepID=UPI0037525637